RRSAEDQSPRSKDPCSARCWAPRSALSTKASDLLTWIVDSAYLALHVDAIVVPPLTRGLAHRRRSGDCGASSSRRDRNGQPCRLRTPVWRCPLLLSQRCGRGTGLESVCRRRRACVPKRNGCGFAAVDVATNVCVARPWH